MSGTIEEAGGEIRIGRRRRSESETDRSSHSSRRNHVRNTGELWPSGRQINENGLSVDVRAASNVPEP